MIKESLALVPLEPYAQRYTSYLGDVEEKIFSQSFKTVSHKPKEGIVMDIQSGRVLDTYNRPLWCMNQMQSLLTKHGKDLGKVYFSDFYHTGLDALRYSGIRHQAYAFLWAQTFDQYDFTASDHMEWMRPYEAMALSIYRKVFVASAMLKELIVSAFPNTQLQVEVVGLPFDSAHVKSLADFSLCPTEKIDVVYSSRWDLEKNPQFFLSLVKSMDGVKFAVCTGSEDLRGTDFGAIAEAKRLEESGRLRIYRGLNKASYLAILSRSTIQFNCSLQDWVSFTLLEGLTMGCIPVYPNHRSFPVELYYDPRFLYAPFVLADAVEKVRNVLQSKMQTFPYKDTILDRHDGALHRVADIIQQD